MADKSQEICNIVKKCKILLLDIEGTTTSISFVKEKLFPYAEENVQQFLESEWETDAVKEVVSGLRKLYTEDVENELDGVVSIAAEDAPKEEQIEGLVNNVKWLMSADRKVEPLKSLQGLIWKKGYDSGEIKGHVYDDVSPALEMWHSVEGQKVYIYSSGSVHAQKLLFGQSQAGNLLEHIDGHFDTAVGAKQDADSYRKIVQEIGCKPQDVLFLTDILAEAEAANSAGLNAGLLTREGNASLPDVVSFPLLSTFAQLTTAQKRKPEDAQEEQPAKVLKTETDADVKTSSEAITNKDLEKSDEKTDKMEVEDETSTLMEETHVESNKDVEKTAIVNAEEITKENVTDVPMSEINSCKENEKFECDKPVGQTDDTKVLNETEKKETQTDVESSNQDIPPVVEIEDITDKQSLGDVAEIIEDLKPIVKEPSEEKEIEDLQNVGDVLEKECDEILSKVQDVTNLDNIPIKPLISITEENMETENGDSSDIVDGILDTELELEIKKCQELDFAVTEMTDKNTEEIRNTDSEKTEEVRESDNKDEKVENGVASVSEKTDKSALEEKVEENVLNESKNQEDREGVLSASNLEVNETKDSKVIEANGNVEEKQLSAKATNGDLNGVAKTEELSSRLSVENGKMIEDNKPSLNGSNGDSAAANGDDAKEIPDIKVKTVAKDEAQSEVIDQPVEG